MAIRFLIPCECGETTPVSAGQAGDQVACVCGKTLQVPPLRELTNLAREDLGEAPSGSAWGLRQAILTAGLFVALALGAGAGYFAVNEPEPPAPFNPDTRAALLDINIERLTPVQMWVMWKVDYAPLAERGFQKVESPVNTKLNSIIGKYQLFRNILAAAAAIVVILSGALYLALPK